MKIKKINNDKLKIILSSTDLYEKNIDIDSFLANPIESQNLFFEILDLAEEKYNFDIENNRAIIETISLENNIFILTITKLKNDICTYNNNPKAYYFENINDLLNFYSIINKNNIHLNTDNLYQFQNKYYFLLHEENKYLESFLLEFSSPLNDYLGLKDLFEEYGNHIKSASKY